MMGVAVLMVGVERAGGWNGGSPLATRQGENEALNGVLNGGWWRQKKCCPKVPISYVFRGWKKWQKNGVGVTVGVTNGVTFFAIILNRTTKFSGSPTRLSNFFAHIYKKQENHFEDVL